jgi:hypothetical protein
LGTTTKNFARDDRKSGRGGKGPIRRLQQMELERLPTAYEAFAPWPFEAVANLGGGTVFIEKEERFFLQPFEVARNN